MGLKGANINSSFTILRLIALLNGPSDVLGRDISEISTGYQKGNPCSVDSKLKLRVLR